MEAELKTSESYPVHFSGKFKEFFGIWIVNLLLTVVTLGIYSAWAKVRTRKYIYGNVSVADSRFDYHADPVRILIGRAITLVLGALYLFGGHVSIVVPLVVLVLFVILFPWIMVRALIFNMTNTSLRNMRFGFQKDYKESYKTYLKGILISVFTLGLGAPYALYLHTKFRINRIRYGKTHFSFDGSWKRFYAIYGYFLLFSLLGLISSILLFATKSPVLVFIGILTLYAGIGLGTAFFRAGYINLLMNETRFDKITFSSRLEGSKVAFIYLTNVIGCVLSLGLLIPWATVRSLKYRYDCTTVLGSTEALHQVQAAAQSEVDATSDAAADFWDLDLGF